MRSRTIREGSVGLLILLGLGLFGLLVIWLRGLNPGNRSYRAIVEFADIGGMRTGAPVRYRGVIVGKISAIRPGINRVEVELEITPASLLIPRDSIIEVNQAGLIGETAVDITPSRDLPTTVATNPLAPDCPGSLIICDGDRVSGLVGVNFNELISATVRLTDLFSDPTFFGEIRTLASNTSDAAAGVAVLSREVTRLTRSVERELGILSASANATTSQVGRAANQIGLTAAQVNNLLVSNRTTLSNTLNNLNAASNRLQGVLSRLAPVVEEGEFVENLQTLSVNASQASTNLRNLSEALGSQENLVLLQQTLDSARTTFQNAQKITADLDELTGDPEFRQNVRDLIDGLSSLVSSTQQLQQQTELARVLESQAIALQTQPTPQPTPQPTHIAPPQPGIPASSSTSLTLLDPSHPIRLQPFTIDTAQSQGEKALIDESHPTRDGQEH